MKSLLLVLALALGLVSCKKSAADQVPMRAYTCFDTEFGLQYKQQAQLLSGSGSELMIHVADFSYALCPPTILCPFANYVAPALHITDARGQTQVITPGIAGPRDYSTNWIETIRFRANNRHYVLYYLRWEQHIPNQMPNSYFEKESIAVFFRVARDN